MPKDAPEGTNQLILGGRRSGKSAYAETLALETGLPKTYLATSRAYDADHAARISAHRERREGQGWSVIESPDPLTLPDQLNALAQQEQVVLVDCLSMWLNNLFLDDMQVPDLTIPRGKARFIFVSMEVGLGLHPETSLGRRYADALGTLNQAIAAQVDRVTFVAAGLPLNLKG